ncbi:hypothetical protein [Calothrix sp. NIES-2100]|uniref:hypothetical protein n=1 Tax=Calothrix sp. NIES-2100 TaxID=1954172 RepID=UPI0030DC0F48
MKVRRDNVVVDIPFTNKDLLNVDSLIQFVGSNDGYLVGFYDQSRRARHSFQEDITKQPKIIVDGIFNPEGIQFSNDSLVLNSSWLQAQESTIIVRENTPNITTSNWFIQTTNNLPNENIILGYADQNTFRATQFDNVLNYDNPSINFPLNTKRVWAVTSGATGKKVYLDGTLVASS